MALHWLLALALGAAPRYAAKPLRCYDGDTCTFDITLEERTDALGLGVMRQSRTWLAEQTVRLCDVDAPEMRGDKAAAQKARDALMGWLQAAAHVELEVVQKPKCVTACDRHEKYGRWLAYVYADGVSLNVRLVQEGLAQPYILCR